MNAPKETTPNADAIPADEMRIGGFSCRPFTLQTLIVLEAVNSPLVSPVIIDADGNARPRPFQMRDIAVALWVFCNWHRPDIMLIIHDDQRFNNEIAHLAGTLTMADIPAIQRDLAKVFESVNSSMNDAGLKDGEGDSEKKGVTGPSES